MRGFRAGALQATRRGAAMTARERRGVVIFVLLFLGLGTALAILLRRDSPATGTFEDNPIVEQRLINLQKSR